MRSQLIEKISPFQLFVLILLFEIGSTVVVGTGGGAKQDTWIGILLGCAAGIVLMLMYCKISSAAPGKHLFEMMKIGFGKWPSLVLTAVYVIYFLYTASRVLRDFMELLITDIFPNTPLEVLSVLFMLVDVYIIYLGIETLSRSAEIFLPYFLLFLFSLFLFLMISGEISMERLQPVLAEGWGPVLQSVFPGIVTFPFGEAVVFTMVLGYTQTFRKVWKVSIFSIGLSGILLSAWTAVDIGVLGADTRERSTFPLLNTIREISVANFIERLDALVVFIMMLGIFVKVSLYFFGALKGLEFMTNIPYRQFTFPVGMLIGVFSVFIAPNFSHHLEEGLQFIPKVMHVPLQIVLPVFLLIALQLWKRRNSRHDPSKSRT